MMLTIKRGLMAVSLLLVSTCGDGPIADYESLAVDGATIDEGPAANPGGRPETAEVDDDVGENPCDQY